MLRAIAVLVQAMPCILGLSSAHGSGPLLSSQGLLDSEGSGILKRGTRGEVLEPEQQQHGTGNASRVFPSFLCMGNCVVGLIRLYALA